MALVYYLAHDHRNPTPDNSLGFVWDAATEDSFKHLNIDSAQPSMGEDKMADVSKNYYITKYVYVYT